MKKPETTPRQRAIKDAFQSCLSAESTQIRDEQLRTVEKDDPDLAAEVRALLNAAGAGNALEQVFGFVSDPKFEVTHDSEPQPSSASRKSDKAGERPGTIIGHYKLLEQIGEGGMGAVFMAQQTQPIKRKVALKVIKPGMDTGQVVARFEAERQALAMMDHPNIARVLDAGTTEQGRPYFVMELVRGIPITDYCASHKFSTDARLKLFIDVCHGVQHAHQKGIIHRDLKPSNVLVTLHDGKPVVKIIDFGIAKAMNQDLTDRTLFTNFAQMIGTPLYMSPEQAELSGLDVDTRSDVYSLGVLLYELLTGSTPFDRETLKKVGIEEIRRLIRETDPPKPSQRLSTLKAQAESTLKDSQTRDLKRSQLELQGELDWIVMKSLEKERARRYESASAFAADVQRYLDDESVLACPPSTVYRFKKFARRNKAKFATVGFVVAALILGAAVSVWQAVRATQAETQANANAERAVDQEQFALAEAQKARAAAAAEREAREAETLERERAIASEQESKAQLYNADMRLGLVDWESGNSARLTEKLMSHVPLPGDKDRRGWEWYYLLGLCKRHEKSFMDRAGRTNAVAWSPNGKLLASTSEDGKLIVYDGNSWKPVKSIQTKSGAFMRGLSWSADSRKVAWGSPFDVSLQDIDAESSVLLGNSKYSVWATTWSPDGKKLASAGMDTRISIWDLETGSRSYLSATLNDWVYLLAWSPDGKWLLSNASAGVNSNCVWDVANDRLVENSPSIRNARSAAWSPDGTLLVFGTSQGACLLYNTDDWTLVREWQTNFGSISTLAWSGDGRQIASAGDDRVIKIWNLSTGELIQTFQGSLSRVSSASFEPNGNRIASADDLSRVWLLSTAPSYRKLLGCSTFTRNDDLKWGTDGKTLISLRTESLERWNAEDGEKIAKVEIPLGNKMAFSNDGRRFLMTVSVGDGYEIQLFDANDGKLVQTITEVSKYSVGQNAPSLFSPDGRQVAFQDRSPTKNTGFNVNVVSIDGQKKHIRFPEDITSIESISWSPNGKFLAAAGLGPNQENFRLEGCIHIFDVASQRRMELLRQSKAVLKSIDWSQDGKRLASGDQDGVVVVWDMQTNRRVLSTAMHSTPIVALAWSPDGMRICSTGRDGAICIWDSRTGEELVRFNQSSTDAIETKWSDDGQRLAATDRSGSIHVWDASIGFGYEKDYEFSEMLTRSRLAKATSLWGQGREDEAKEIVKQALEGRAQKNKTLSPWVSAAAFNLISLSGNDLSIQQLMIKCLPEQASFLERYILALLSQKRLKEAVTLLRSSFDVVDNVDEPVDSVSSLISLLDQHMLLQDNEAYRPLNNTAWQLASNLDGKLQEFMLAVELAKRSIRIEPSFANAYNTLGVAQYRAGKWKESIIDLEKSMELRDGGDSFDWYFLAMSHWQLDQRSEALKWYQKALDAVDGKTPANEELARFHDEATKLLDIETKSSDEPSVAPNRNE